MAVRSVVGRLVYRCYVNMKTVLMNNSVINVNDYYFQHSSASSRNQHLKVVCSVQKATFRVLNMQFTSTRAVKCGIEAVT